MLEILRKNVEPISLLVRYVTVGKPEAFAI